MRIIETTAKSETNPIIYKLNPGIFTSGGISTVIIIAVECSDSPTELTAVIVIKYDPSWGNIICCEVFVVVSFNISSIYTLYDIA